MKKIGEVTQRELVPTLNTLIDAAMAPNSTAHRDIARSKLRRLLETANWRTSFVLNNIGPKRSRYIASIGFWVPSRWTLSSYKRRPGVEKPDVSID